MARWENFIDFGIAPQNNFYYYWQREKLEILASPSGYHYDNWYEQLLSFHSLHCYNCAYTVDRTCPSLPSVREAPEPPAGTSVVPEEATAPPEDHDEDALEDPNLHLNIEELNKEFMEKSEELYDSLMSCHWQPLDTVYSNIPEETPK